MGFFDRFKSERDIAKEEINKIPWKYLETIADLDEIDTTSQTKFALIFKHSTTCGISRMILRDFENEYDFSEENFQPFFLDLRKNRDVSNTVAEKYNVIHESPQVLLIKNGKSVFDTSHGRISVEKIKEEME